LNLAPGTAVCSNVVRTYAGGTLTLAPSATNYVYLDPTNNCAPASNTTGFTTASIPIATVVTTSAGISSVTDVRTMFVSGGSGNASGMGNGSTVVDASLQAGSDACAKITAAGQSLGSASGIVDARGITGTQNCASNLNFLGLTYLFSDVTLHGAPGVQFFYNPTTMLVGVPGNGSWGQPGTVLSCNVAAPCLQPYGETYRTPASGNFNSGSGGGLYNVTMEHVTVTNTNVFGTAIWQNTHDSLFYDIAAVPSAPGYWLANHSYSLGNQVSDGIYVQQVTVAGTSAAGSGPSFNQTIGGTTSDNSVTWTNEGLLGVAIDSGAPNCGGNYYNKFFYVLTVGGRGWLWECYTNDNTVFRAKLWASKPEPGTNSLELMNGSLENHFFGVNVESSQLEIHGGANYNEFYSLYKEAASVIVDAGAGYNQFYGGGDVFGNDPVTSDSGIGTQIQTGNVFSHIYNNNSLLGLRSTDTSVEAPFWMGNSVIGGGTSPYAYVEAAHAPTGLTLTPSSSGGAIPAGTYYYKATAYFYNYVSRLETLPSGEHSVTLSGSTSSVSGVVSGLPEYPPYNVNVGNYVGGYAIYRGTTSGGENCLVYFSPGSGSSDSTSWSDTSSSCLASNTPPTAATALAWSVDANGSMNSAGTGVFNTLGIGTATCNYLLCLGSSPSTGFNFLWSGQGGQHELDAYISGDEVGFFTPSSGGYAAWSPLYGTYQTTLGTGLLVTNAANTVSRIAGDKGDTGSLQLYSTGVNGWGSGDALSTSLDTGLSRISANLVGLGNGTAGDYSGTLKLTDLIMPSSSAPGSPVSGEEWNLSGIRQFYDGSHTNSFTTIQTAPTSLDLPEFNGTLGLLADSGIAVANLPTQSSNGAANQIATYSGSNKALVPATTLPTAAEPAHTGDMTNSAGSLATTVTGLHFGSSNAVSLPSSAPTSGGVPYFSSASALASSAALTQYGLVYGGGAGAAPVSMAACGANFPVIGQSSAAPACSTIAHPSSLTQGGLIYASSSTAMAGGSALTQYGVVLAGAVGSSPVSTAQGAANMPLIGQGAANPIFSTIAYPTSLTSGGFLYASSTTGFASSSLITANVLPKSGGTGTAPAASSITDNGTDVTTTEPLIGSNSSFITSSQTTTSSTLATLNLALPAIPVSTKVRGSCDLIWQTSATADTVVFGINTNNAPTDLWVIASTLSTATSVTATTITTATTTAVTGSLTASAASTSYLTHLAFTLSTSSSNTVTLSIYGDIASSGTLTLEPGSACGWEP
jgi:hypothetical protein